MSLIFTITSTDSLSKSEWKTIRVILKTGLSQGLGGKTSSGYGLPFLFFTPDIQVRLIGTGLTSSLLNGEFEFRPNLFKAVLRGHASRLLAGCSNNSDFIEGKVKELFGSTNSPSQIEIYCDIKSPPDKWNNCFENLQLDLSVKIADNSKSKNVKIEFLKTVLKFAYTMGGFGKSWRRVWHEDFYPDKKYTKLIGCHWKSNDDWIDDIKNEKDLGDFLNNLDVVRKEYLGVTSQNPESSINWRETWHNKRVSVYTSVTDPSKLITEQSKTIKLFHQQEKFKTTPAIGGRQPGDDRPTSVSCVWHRMLPIGNNQYLEIVTIFHGDHHPWKRVVKQRDSNGKEILENGKPIILEQTDQLKPFIDAIENRGLKLLPWGTDPFVCHPESF